MIHQKQDLPTDTCKTHRSSIIWDFTSPLCNKGPTAGSCQLPRQFLSVITNKQNTVFGAQKFLSQPISRTSTTKAPKLVFIS